MRRSLPGCRIGARRQAIKKDFELVGGDDAIGKSEKYRKCYFVVRVNGVLRNLCWMKRAVDHSLFFGLSKPNFLAREVGIKEITGDTSKTIEMTDLTTQPKERRTNPKASLHPAIPGRAMPRTHIRSTDGTYLLQEPYFDWYPVKAPFMWLQAQSGPLKDWPAVGMLGPRDADIDLPPDTESVRVTVEVLPLVNGQLNFTRYPYSSVTGFGDDYGVQIAFHPERAARAGIQFFTQNLRRFQGPIKPAAPSKHDAP